jgi:putative tryptophan/tyrosine transport system substrate-binding protein
MKNIIILLIFILLIGGFYFYGDSFMQKPIPEHTTIGILHTDKTAADEKFAGFKDHLQELGYVEGENITYLELFGERDKELLEKYAKEIAENSEVDIIVSAATTATNEFQKLDEKGMLKTTVFILEGSPTKFVTNPDAPDGWFTGIGTLGVETSAKRLEILQQIDPSIKRVASIVEKDHGTADQFRKVTETAAEKLGLEMVFLEVEFGSNGSSALPQLTKENADAYLQCTCPAGSKVASKVIEKTKEENILAANHVSTQGAQAGYLFTYSEDRRLGGKEGAKVVDRILRGTPISKIPLKFTGEFLLELNLQTASDIGITVPEEVRLQAVKIYGE